VDAQIARSGGEAVTKEAANEGEDSPGAPPVGALPPDPPAWPAEFAARYPFPLDDFQRRAIAVLAAAHSVLVAAPTGSGKTIVAEYATFRAHRGGGRIVYTTPIKALSNQKYVDLRAVYGDDVGLLTGDITENPAARIRVMTTEILRNMMMQSPWELLDVSCVVFDEVHYLADPERGTTWEESIILCPEHIQLVCLSATVSNAGDIAAWISRTHRPIELITHLERAVPLSLYYYLDRRLELVRDAAGQVVGRFDHIGGEARRRLGDRGRGRHRNVPAEPGQPAEPGVVEIITALDRADMLPAIYFLFSRRDCEQAAEQAAHVRLGMMRDPDRLRRIDDTLARHLAPLRHADLRLDQVQAIARLARRGLGFHHAGLLPPLKRLVEDLFTQGLMGAVFATDTLALGVNMPARTVVVGRMAKYDGVSRRLLLPNEFQQMAGRAGRRGLDPEGFVVIPYSPWVTFRDSLQIATGPLLPVLSAFAIRYNSVLNLWDPPRGSRVKLLLHKSLHEFQTDTRLRDLEEEVVAVQQALSALPAGCSVGHPDSAEPLHEYTGLGRSLAAARDLVRQHERDRQRLESEVHRTPWTPPSREALRRAFRHMAPGTPLHHEREGWGLYLGPAARGGPGLCLFGRRAVALSEYRAIDYLVPESDTVPLPAALATLTGPVADVTPLVTEADQAALGVAVGRLDLPDLAAWQASFRAERERELAADFQRNATVLAQASAVVDDLVAARAAHVCHSCPQRKEQQAVIQQHYRLERERQDAEERLQRQVRREQQRVERVVGGIAGVLHAFGYLDRGNVTAKADMLASIFDTNGLILCEAIDRGWLDDLEADDLAEVCSWFAFDRDARFGNQFLLPHGLLALRRRLEELENEVFREERRADLAISTGYHRGFYGVARAWCRGDELADIAAGIELGEGDLVTTLNKTLDLMRQLRDMLVDVAPERQLRHRFDWAIKLVQRDIIAQSYSIAALDSASDPMAADTPTGGDHAAGASPAEDAGPPRRPRRAHRAAARSGGPSPARSRQTPRHDREH
jgi:ATP-dependent RNA helicase HelY